MLLTDYEDGGHFLGEETQARKLKTSNIDTNSHEAERQIHASKERITTNGRYHVLEATS